MIWRTTAMNSLEAIIAKGKLEMDCAGDERELKFEFTNAVMEIDKLSLGQSISFSEKHKAIAELMDYCIERMTSITK